MVQTVHEDSVYDRRNVDFALDVRRDERCSDASADGEPGGFVVGRGDARLDDYGVVRGWAGGEGGPEFVVDGGDGAVGEVGRGGALEAGGGVLVAGSGDSVGWDGTYSAVEERKKRGEMSVAVAVAVALATAMVKTDSIGSNMFAELDSVGVVWCGVSTRRVYLFHCIIRDLQGSMKLVVIGILK